MRPTLHPLLITALVTFLGARAVPLCAQTQAMFVHVDSIHVTGNQRQATPVVLADLGIRPGDNVTGVQLRRGVQRLHATGQYEDVRIYAVGPIEAATLVVELVERPFITRYRFEGLEHISAGSIRDTAQLVPNTPLNPNDIFEAERQIKAELSKKGYVRATVDTTLIAGERSGEYQLVFLVDEGRRLVVARIDFEGNEALSDDEIIDGMSVKPEGFMWYKTGEFRLEDYEADLEANLSERYAELGYLDFRVLGDSMIVDPESGKTVLTIRVEEGEQYRVGDFQIQGNTHFPTEVLRVRFRMDDRSLLTRLPLIGRSPEEGDPIFNATAWREATQNVQNLYRNAGFLYAQIEPIVERLPDDEDDQGRVRLIWRIQENPRAYVSLVTITGNTTTHERVIRERLTLLPGDVYSDDRIISSYQTIQGLGFFEPLPPQEALQVEPNQEGNIDVGFKVQEKQTGNINFGASLSPSAGVAGFIGYEQPNLFGRAKIGRFRWLFGSRTNDIEVGYTDPSLFGSRNSMSLSLRSSRDRFSFIGLGRRRQVGGSIRFGTPLFGARWTRVSIGYSLFRDEFDQDNADELDLEQRQLLSVGTRSTIDFRVTRDTRNHPLFPSIGSRNSIRLGFTGGILGGDGDYTKIEFESEWYTPVARLRSDPTKTPIDLVLGFKVLGGAIFGVNPFFYERFFMGGVQYGTPLRGYEELTITPAGHVPRERIGFSQFDRVGESFFALSGSLGLSLSSSFFINTFYDAGRVWTQSIGFDPTDLFRGMGFGVTLVTPVGPLGLDYAYAPDRRDVFGRPDPGWRLHFRFGQIF